MTILSAASPSGPLRPCDCLTEDKEVFCGGAQAPVTDTERHSALAESLADPTIRTELEKIGFDFVQYQPGSEYDARISKELPFLRSYIHRAKIQVEYVEPEWRVMYTLISSERWPTARQEEATGQSDE